MHRGRSLVTEWDFRDVLLQDYDSRKIYEEIQKMKAGGQTRLLTALTPSKPAPRLTVAIQTFNSPRGCKATGK